MNNVIYRRLPTVQIASVHNTEEDKRWAVVLKLQRAPTWRLVLKFLVLRVRLSILALIDFIGIFINLYINIRNNEKKILESQKKQLKTPLLNLY